MAEEPEGFQKIIDLGFLIGIRKIVIRNTNS
jgi:hypothetical protein